MPKQIVLELPDHALRSAELLARSSQQSVPGIVTEALVEALTGWALWSEPMSTLSDEEVLALSSSQMDPEQSRRLSRLLDKQQAGQLTAEEQPELWTLTRIYQLGQLRKAEALAEAVRRGLCPAVEP